MEDATKFTGQNYARNETTIRTSYENQVTASQTDIPRYETISAGDFYALQRRELQAVGAQPHQPYENVTPGLSRLNVENSERISHQPIPKRKPIPEKQSLDKTSTRFESRLHDQIISFQRKEIAEAKAQHRQNDLINYLEEILPKLEPRNPLFHEYTLDYALTVFGFHKPAEALVAFDAIKPDLLPDDRHEEYFFYHATVLLQAPKPDLERIKDICLNLLRSSDDEQSNLENVPPKHLRLMANVCERRGEKLEAKFYQSYLIGMSDFTVSPSSPPRSATPDYEIHGRAGELRASDKSSWFQLPLFITESQAKEYLHEYSLSWSLDGIIGSRNNIIHAIKDSIIKDIGTLQIILFAGKSMAINIYIRESDILIDPIVGQLIFPHDFHEHHTALLLYADKCDDYKLCSALQNNSNVNATNRQGETALIIAARRKHNEVVSALCQIADVNKVRPSDGWTALHEAAYRGYVAIVGHLVDAGADLEIRNFSGQTARYLAYEQSHWRVLDILEGKAIDYASFK